MARARRITLFEREIRERLSRAALEILFSRADVMSEGQRNTRSGKEVFFGSTMLTFPLPRVAEVVRDACDARCAQRLATLFQTDAVAMDRVRAIATQEAARLAGSPPKSVATEINVHAKGTTVYVDVDVEAVL